MLDNLVLLDDLIQHTINIDKIKNLILSLPHNDTEILILRILEFDYKYNVTGELDYLIEEIIHDVRFSNHYDLINRYLENIDLIFKLVDDCSVLVEYNKKCVEEFNKKYNFI